MPLLVRRTESKICAHGGWILEGGNSGDKRGVENVLVHAIAGGDTVSYTAWKVGKEGGIKSGSLSRVSPGGCSSITVP